MDISMARMSIPKNKMEQMITGVLVFNFYLDLMFPPLQLVFTCLQSEKLTIFMHVFTCISNYNLFY